MSDDICEQLQDRVRAACATGEALNIVGGNSKMWMGRTPQGAALAVAGHRGIVNYEPRELVITARAGTPLAQIEAALAAHGQWLAFEPPHFGPDATLGGTLACGLSGPARPYFSAARDFVLGMKILNGRGEVLRFGGEVMKNVAGYDVSRLMVGAHGGLGVILEASLKVLPRPPEELTLVRECSTTQALEEMATLAARPLPLTAACHDGERLFVRLSAAAAVTTARRVLGGEALADSASFWRSVREQQHAFFQGATPLWRLSLPPATPHLVHHAPAFVDWGGALRWLRGTIDEQRLRNDAARAGGHVTLFRHGDRRGDVHQPLAPPVFALHQRVKQALDPHRIFNRGRLYEGL